MMELRTCAFILLFVSFVTASPYGYGVKGGAGAGAGAFSKAQSTSTAGAFGSRGDIPESVPFENSFSGSFSKSSSSSSSSSSASSSSSSSSFSYSGAGGASFSNPGINGNAGCTSGTCQHSGHGSIDDNANFHGHNIANSGAISGVGCLGPYCDDNSKKCSSGKCQPKPTETSHDSNDKCASGQCGSTSPSNPSLPQYDNTDDIHFVAHSSKSALDSKDLYASGSVCRNGNCGPSSITQPANGHSSSESYPATLNSGVTSGHNVPSASTHFGTPNHSLGCNSGSCKTGYTKPSYEIPSTSYGVPIPGTYYNQGQKPSCDKGICENQQKGSHSSTTSTSLSTNYLNPQESHSKRPSNENPSGSCTGSNCYVHPTSNSPSNGAPSGPSSCSSPNCNPYTVLGTPTSSGVQPGENSYLKPIYKDHSSNNVPVYTGGFGGPLGMLKPNEYQTPVTGSNNRLSAGYNDRPTFVNSPAGCNKPGCSSEHSSPELNPLPNYGNNKPSTSENTQPIIYTGGFGGPAGFLIPNEFNIPTSTSIPYSNPMHNTPSTFVTGCKTSNCIGTSTTTGASSTTAHSGTYDTHTDSGSFTASNNKQPVYTGGFGGPAGMLKPDEFDIKVPIHSGNPSYSNHKPLSSTTGCKAPNCNGYVTKPGPVVQSSSELPLYTGGFGGPSGVLKPNDLNVPHTPSNSYKPIYSGPSPSLTPTSSDAPGCKTHNCVPSSGDTQHSTFTVPKPITGPHPSSIVVPGYTSNHRPIGVTHPSASAVAPITPSYTRPQYSTGSGSYENPLGCRSGDCAGNPSGGVDGSTATVPYGSIVPTNIIPSAPHGLTNPNTVRKPSSTQYIGGFIGASDSHVPSRIDSADCKSPNCANSISTNNGVYTQSGSHAGSKEQLPVYTGGFGAPSGLLKPNDYSAPDVTLKPNQAISGTSKPITCSSGNCNSKDSPRHNAGLNGAYGTASSSASSNAVAYSGGFGGPPGFLTPYDNGKVDFAKIIAKDNQGSYYGGANIATGLTGSQSNIGGSGTGTTAFAGSISSANSGSFQYNAPGNEAGKGIKGGSPCGGGCGGYNNGLQGSGNSAAAGARSLSTSGAFGVGGSSASSSASAHASAGAYTKGGYGKR